MCLGASDDTIKSTQARGPVAVMAHEVGCGPTYGPDRMRVCVSYNRVGNLLYL
jgi:hypothetical protein